MKTIVIVFALVAMAGCTNLSRRVGAEGFDELLDYAEFVLCEAASVGSVHRRYRTQKEYDAWQALCIARVDRDARIVNHKRPDK